MYSIRALSHRNVLAASVAGIVLLSHVKQQNSSCDDVKNGAFVFIKPHANTTKTQALVKETLTNKGIKILKEGELTAEVGG